MTTMTREDLEFSISQYLDGTLPPLERDALDERLATDAQARRILAEFQRLNAELKAALPPPDDVDHDALHARILAATEQVDVPVRNYALPWVSGASRWAAVAAVLLVALGLVALLLRDNTAPPAGGGTSPVAVARVAGPQAQPASAAPVQIISIGPSTVAARGDTDWSQVIVVRPSRVIIASGAPAGQDSGGPY